MTVAPLGIMASFYVKYADVLSESSSSDEECSPLSLENLRSRPKVFLSHNWGTNQNGTDNHALTRRLNRSLQEQGILTWFDDDDMGSDLLASMSSGIDWADIFLIMVTRAYIKKCNGSFQDNCRREFCYASRRMQAGAILPIVVEPECCDQTTWDGPFGLLCSNLLYVDASKHLAPVRIGQAITTRMLSLKKKPKIEA